MSFASFNTLLLTLTGPVTAVLLAAMLLWLRPLRGAQNVWMAVWLIGLAVRFGKSTLNAQVGLDSWAMNLGLAGMIAAPPALLLAIKASAGTALSSRQLIHFVPTAILAIGAPWIPNMRGHAPSVLIYIGILSLWAGYTILSWRQLSTASEQQAPPDRRLMKALIAVTAVTGALFVAVFFGLPQLYLLNCVLFSFVVIGLAALLVTGISSRPKATTPRAPTAEQIALTERARTALADIQLLADPGMSLARMARKLGVPQKTLSTAINVVTGESFITLLNAIRVAAAQRELLATTDSIEDIAARCGFSSASALHRTFRRHVQLTPAAWRRNASSPNDVPSPAGPLRSA